MGEVKVVDKNGGARREERGATLVEFALVAPVFLMMFFGLFEFSRYVATDVSVSTAAREGARFGSAIGDNPTSSIPRYVDCDGIIQAAVDNAPFAGVTAADISVTWDHGPGTEVFADCSIQSPDSPPLPTVSTVSAGDRITVTVIKDYQAVAIPFFSRAGTVQTIAVETRSIFKGEVGG